MATLIDSYSSSNISYDSPISSATYHGQSFTCSQTIPLHSCTFYLKKEAGATGSFYAFLAEHSGTYGTSSVVSGYEIATSGDVSIDAIGTSYTPITFTFTGSQRYNMQSGTYYTISVFRSSGGTGFVYTGTDNTSPSHSGNKFIKKTPYATNDLAFAVYGEAIIPPTVTTQDCSSVYSVKATANGNITSIGSASVTRRGFCYMTGTTGDPTTSNSVAYDDGNFGTGTFNKVITGLSPSTNYRVRPYATNSGGTGYGTTVQLTTLTDEHTLEVSDTMAVGDSYNLRKALKMAGVLQIGTYGGWYVGANYWAGGFTRNFIEEFVDSLKVRDNMSKIAGYVRGLVESLNLSEAFTSKFERAVFFLDSIVVRSGLERLYGMVRGWVESVSLTDTFNRVVGNVREFVESISLTESFNASMVYIKGLVDSIVASDFYANSVGKVLQSVVTVTDTLSSTIALVREFVESVVLQEVFNTAKLFIKILQDSITLADTILQALGKYFVDAINVVDNWWKAFVISLVDTISLEDVLSGFTKIYRRVMQEIISISDLVSKNATIVLASIVKVLDGEFVRKLNGQLIAWGKGIRKVLEWAKVVKKEDEYLTIERKLNDWEVREKDLGLYESKVKPLDEWTKLRKEK